jgi:hypothetical protein
MESDGCTWRSCDHEAGNVPGGACEKRTETIQFGVLTNRHHDSLDQDRDARSPHRPLRRQLVPFTVLDVNMSDCK